ncbi:PKD domain-containing protein [Sabulilitoribacter multivorans]|uniref:PKD domain-containing protein n=1 Tax=Flaviramulus multivorans TaxID=1304750 RepID=A0ABS9IM28_9FLAO|nr:PKD domain-containing protein [Flaviramulus multivorans]MCF7561623.1 PKD domain-containing protein [Flaviramulus multivorans]
MKILKYSFRLFLVALMAISCSQEDDNTDYVKAIAAPTNVSASVSVTQDNTGLVTITPLGEGVVSFTVNFGDGSPISGEIKPGGSVEHTYTEGSYEAIITATGLNGLTTSTTQAIMVSFKSPENLVVTIENDAAISKQVNVTATADYAMFFEVDFGDGSDVVEANIGEAASYIYQDAGTYTITVTAKGAAIETTSYTEEFEVTAILQPLASAPTQPNRNSEDVISIYSSVYTDVADTNYFPDWGQGGQGSSWNEFNLNGDTMLQYINLSYQGIALADGTSIDVSGMEYLHLDVWTAEGINRIETSLINNASGTVTEAPVWSDLTAGEWTSIEIPISDYTDQGLTVTEIFQLKFVGDPWASGTVFIDNIYFYKAPSSVPTGLVGTWKMAEEAGALGVGPAVGDTSWWNCDAGCVTTRACYYDDTYVFGADGSFSNNLGSESWIEGWQGGGDACGTPVAPYDGSASATYTYNESAGTVTVNGTGAYIGIPKANNQGELPNVAVPSSITYNVSFIDANTISVYIEAGSGVFWQFKLVRDGAVASPVAGTWQVASEAGALGVGPAVGDTSWWNCDAGCVTTRACYYDDTFVFETDGSFVNSLGSESWIEGWQGGGDACGTPVAPYDGTASATYAYDSGSGTITINGTGAYIGIPKANNQGELPNVAVPSSITYNVSFIDANTMSVYVEAGSGVFWQFKLVRI